MATGDGDDTHWDNMHISLVSWMVDVALALQP